MKHGEVSHIATVQLYGWIGNEDDTDRAVRSRAFATLDDATHWVVRELNLAHGGVPTLKLDDHGGALVTTDEGPTWGYVVNVGMFR